MENRNSLTTYYSVGKLLNDAGKYYGKSIIKRYSEKLSKELNKKYSTRTLYNMRLYYIKFSENQILQPLVAKLSWSHYCELLRFNDPNKIVYYITVSINENLSKRELLDRIKLNEYERLDSNTKVNILNQSKNSMEVTDFIKNPIIIKNRLNTRVISEKILKQLILDDIGNFLKELGSGFSYIDNEYKIKIGDRYNYIDILLYNIKYSCYVVVELKVTELKAEYIGQITKYMNYIDKNIKSIEQEPTIGIIIVRRDNQFIMEYCSNEKIVSKEYMCI